MHVELLVEGEGLTEVETVSVLAGSGAKEIVIAVAGKGGFPAEEALLFVEDCDEPVDIAVAVVDDAAGRRVHQVHRAHHVDVVVFWDNREKAKRFSPSTRVQRVLDWAVGPTAFNIDPALATEMELALHGQSVPLPLNAHLGRFVRHGHHRLELDLIRGVVPNG